MRFEFNPECALGRPLDHTEDPKTLLQVVPLRFTTPCSSVSLYGRIRYLLETLKRMTLAPDGGNNMGSSVTVSFKRPSPFRHIKELEKNLGDIKMSVLSKLLQGVKRLKTFDFTSSADTTFDFNRLNRELLKYSQGPLQKLVLHDDSARKCYMGHLTGCKDERRRRLADALLMSIQEITQLLFCGHLALNSRSKVRYLRVEPGLPVISLGVAETKCTWAKTMPGLFSFSLPVLFYLIDPKSDLVLKALYSTSSLACTATACAMKLKTQSIRSSSARWSVVQGSIRSGSRWWIWSK